VLVADLSGFTALSERMDVERVRDAINAMWRVLDAVIRDWGGQIEQHAGDSLLALFGLPQPRRGDAMRAVHAALIMQRELDLFNERVRRADDDSPDSPWADDWPGPEMRIGLHSGPVYFARPGHRAAREGAASARPTAVGDTVALARGLEELAPVGGVLVSETVFHQTQNQFHFQPVEEARGGRAGIGPVYRALTEREVSQGYTPGPAGTGLSGRRRQPDAPSGDHRRPARRGQVAAHPRVRESGRVAGRVAGYLARRYARRLSRSALCPGPRPTAAPLRHSPATQPLPVRG